MSTLQQQTQQEEIKTLAEMLFNRYGKIALTTEDTSKAIDRSVPALKKDRESSHGIPYSKTARQVRYNVYDIAKHLVKTKIRLAS